MATDVNSHDAEVNKEIARQFAREKQLQLMECDIDDINQVEDTFTAIVETIMDTWDGGAMIGECAWESGRGNDW